MLIAHILPTVPPAVDGLADYSRMLWRHWPLPRPEWRLLACRVPEAAGETWPEVPITRFEPSRAGLLRTVREAKPTHIVVHYSGYGYQPKGCPTWLPAALRQWRTGDDVRLITMFHELYATGKPWSSAFWLSGIQRGIVRDLVSLSDHWITSCTEYFDKILRLPGADENRGALLPIGTNVSPARPVDFGAPWPKRPDGRLNVALFGLPRTRLSALKAHERLLSRMVESGMVESIALIGKSDADPARNAEVDSLRARVGGTWRGAWDLTADEISAELAEKDLGLIPNVETVVTKSGAYAAFCAHGVPAIIPGPEPRIVGAPYPYLVNDDDAPDWLLCFFIDREAMLAHRRLLGAAAQGPLHWNSIVCRWQEIVGCAASM